MPQSFPTNLPPTVILMGVCGCGKSLIGQMLADEVGGMFEDADHFHSKENVAKMSAGIPLTDEDRWPWYATLRARILEMREKTKCYVLACSALKQAYRDALRGDDTNADLVFIYLEGSRELIKQRMASRKGHYMPASLVDSQFAILEEPRDAIRVGVDQTPEEILLAVLNRLGYQLLIFGRQPAPRSDLRAALLQEMIRSTKSVEVLPRTLNELF